MNQPYERILPINNKEELQFDIRLTLNRYLSYWPWFFISILICLVCGYIYAKKAVPMYRISARILVNDEKRGGGLTNSSEALGDLGGLLGAKSTVDNEVEIIKTKYLMKKVVNDLQLNINYFTKDYFRNTELYEVPFRINPINLKDTIENIPVQVTFLEGEKISLVANDFSITVRFNEKFMLPSAGEIMIVRNLKYKLNKNYIFSINSINNTATEILKSLNASVANKQITIIDLNLDHTIPNKGEDILNRLIYNYVQENLKDKNEVADSTIAFIKRRLLIIGSELGEAEGNIQGFKQQNNLADMSEQGKLLVASNSQYISDMAKIETQISIIESVLEYLKNNSSRVLPSTLMPTDLIFNAAIESYNSLLLERSKKLIGLSESNPIITNYDNQLANARVDIISNLNSTLRGLVISRRKLDSEMSSAEGKIKEVPATERNYLQLARQQQIKQELYIFLMQKSEETAISKTANIANSKTIDPPAANPRPFTPLKSRIYLFSLSLGVILPVFFIYIKNLLNNKIESKEDIFKLTNVSVIGEIGHDGSILEFGEDMQSRTVISEQFRALRTNLSFYLTGEKSKVLLITSSMSGEGKSFIGVNLGLILALSGKKVLLMELDLRKPGLTTKLGLKNKIGFTNYIVSETLTPDEIILPLTIHPNLFLISSGPTPPNPAETLLTTKAGALIERLKDEFDYIIIDAPPIGIVTDAQLLSEYADICLYVVRQNYTYKHQLDIPHDLYQSKKMKKIGIVINDIKLSKSYGYGYGYNYGNY